MGIFLWIWSYFFPEKNSPCHMRRIAGSCDTPGRHILIAQPGKGRKITVSSYALQLRAKDASVYFGDNVKKLSIPWKLTENSKANNACPSSFECPENEPLCLFINGEVIVDYEVSYDIVGA